MEQKSQTTIHLGLTGKSVVQGEQKDERQMKESLSSLRKTGPKSEFSIGRRKMQVVSRNSANRMTNLDLLNEHNSKSSSHFKRREWLFGSKTPKKNPIDEVAIANHINKTKMS